MAEPQKSILIAEIGAAHGIRGEGRVKAHTADPRAIADYGPLYDSRGGIFRVRSLRHLKDDMLVVAFEGVTDRTAAEKFTRTKLFVDRSALPPPDEDEFYHADLVGLAVETVAGEAIGTVTAVVNFGADDLLDVRRPGGTSVYVPFTRAIVPTLDFSAGKAIIAPPEGLLEEGGEPDEEEAP